MLPGASDSGLVAAGSGAGPAENFERRIKPAPQERLARMVDLSEERTAMILRKWAHKEAA
jgi:flagellar M-ring protein FliF